VINSCDWPKKRRNGSTLLLGLWQPSGTEIQRTAGSGSKSQSPARCQRTNGFTRTILELGTCGEIRDRRICGGRIRTDVASGLLHAECCDMHCEKCRTVLFNWLQSFCTAMVRDGIREHCAPKLTQVRVFLIGCSLLIGDWRRV